VAEIAVSRTSVGGGELVGEHFGSDAIDGAREVTVGHGSVPCLDEPEGLTAN